LWLLSFIGCYLLFVPFLCLSLRLACILVLSCIHKSVYFLIVISVSSSLGLIFIDLRSQVFTFFESSMGHKSYLAKLYPLMTVLCQAVAVPFTVLILDDRVDS